MNGGKSQKYFSPGFALITFLKANKNIEISAFDHIHSVNFFPWLILGEQIFLKPKFFSLNLADKFIKISLFGSSCLGS